MKQKSLDKLVCFEFTDSDLCLPGAVSMPVGKTHLPLFDTRDPVIADCHPMSIPA